MEKAEKRKNREIDPTNSGRGGAIAGRKNGENKRNVKIAKSTLLIFGGGPGVGGEKG